ncbi:low temperature requirement protein A [Phycicoccus sp. Root101]|uniref:low temperature requirement protein A n=1 Tax=Phycicoccus sp. Root101 TaxID=1736421 RepID=UPI000702F516|nr:low temperature requirement protein A [Phycicoccus sp. Root101]KQU70271.1 low temperature requirement protein A [Phycicoccus sp. Root101]
MDVNAEPGIDQDDRTTDTLELFFDLVFVFAMSEVTQLMLAEGSWLGLGRGALALTAVWWAWVCYAWLTNTTADAGVAARILTLAAMAAMLVAATALPDAFGSRALLFAVAYLCVRLVHLVLLLLDTGQNREQRSAAMRLLPTLLAGACLLVIAAFLDTPYREWAWVLAALIDLGGPLVLGVGGLRVLPRYFVDRHGSIIIIALGETILQVGTGAHPHLSDAGVITAVVLALLIAGQLWWSYFGLTDAAQARLVSTPGLAQTRLARDAYSYLHLLIVAGIVFFALGLHRAIDKVFDPLPLLHAVALTGGVALAYVGDVAYRWRDHHRLAADRLIAAAASGAIVAPALFAPAVLTLAALVAIGAVRIVWEARDRLAATAEPQSSEYMPPPI